MTQKTWNGSNGQFFTPSAWSPVGAPTDGDIAIINDGIVTESGSLPAAFLVRVNGGGGSPVLTLTNTIILAGSHLALAATGSDVNGTFSGQSVVKGSIDLSGSSPGNAILRLTDNGSTATNLTNASGINIVGTSAILQSVGTNIGTSLVNNGIISIRNPAGSSVVATTDILAISGTGSIRLGDKVSLEVGSSVGTGQTIVFEPGTGTAGQLQIDSTSLFSGTISGFGALDKITEISPIYDSYSYVGSASNSGSLVFTSNGATVSSIAFNGNYTTSSFTLGTQLGSTFEKTVITTSVPDAVQAIAYTDVVSNISAADVAQPYSDPNVPYLNYAYFWNSSDAVAIAASVSNVFLHGNSAGDALQAFGGQNVLDGGGGSNFLIGATGSDGGSDVFFVDGRDQVNTWSTIVNFHKGDTAVIFGFKQGISTQPWTASDGAAGYAGATLHSELNGAGTGVNGSMTFTGISLPTQQGFEITYGSAAAQGNDYIMVKYT